MSADDTLTDTVSREWGNRRKMPPRRNSTTYGLSIAGQKLFLTVGFYPDGKVGEIFLNLDRDGSTLSSVIDSFCIAFSFALQWGAPLDGLVGKFLWTRCEPCGEVRGHPDIVRASSIQDLVARVLAIDYLGRRELGHAEMSVPTNCATPDMLAALTGVADERASLDPVGYGKDGFCDTCGSGRLTRAGACLRCEDCGTNSGCS
jgi:ribonucleoside-diphosphate reductase alpha chain